MGWTSFLMSRILQKLMSRVLQKWWQVTSKIMLKKPDFCPASLFSPLPSCLPALGKPTALSCPVGRTPDRLLAGQQGTEILSPIDPKEWNPGTIHLRELTGRFTLTWALRFCLQPQATPWLQSCGSQRDQLSCTQMPDPQKPWDSKCWCFKWLGFGVICYWEIDN